MKQQGGFMRRKTRDIWAHASYAKMGMALLMALGVSLAAGCGDDDDNNNPPPVSTASLNIESPTTGSTLNDDDDANSSEDGLQPLFKINVEDLSEGEVRLSASAEGDPNEHDTVFLEVNGDGTLETNELTILTGRNLITADLLAADGTTLLSQASITLTKEAVEPDPPEVSFSSPGDGATLGEDDDKDSDRPGLQYDVVVDLENVPEDSDLTLRVNGGAVATGQSSTDNYTFTDVTLPEGEDIEVSVFVDAINGSATETVTVTVDLPDPPEACDVSFAPAPAGSCDFTSASDDLSDDPGVQTEFTVTTDCDEATLVVNGDTLTRRDVENGSATFVVTLDEGENRIKAEVFGAEPGRDNDTSTLTYEVDTLGPQVSFSDLESGALINSASSGDTNTDDGITFEVVGTLTGGDRATLSADGEVVGTADVGDNGRVTFEVTLEEGNHTLELSSGDECDNLDTEQVAVTVSYDQRSITIISPENAANFGPLDDLDDEAEGLQTDFTISADGIDQGTRVQVECRLEGQQSFLTRSEALALPSGGEATLRATFMDGLHHCRVTTVVAEGETPVRSGEITLGVSLLLQAVEFTFPQDGAVVGAETSDVSALTHNVLEGTTATLRVGDNDPIEVTVTDNGVLFDDVPLEEGENTLVVSIVSEQMPTDQMTIIRDTTAPGIAFTFPTSDNATVVEGDDASGTLDDGIAIDVRLQLDGAEAGNEACVQTTYGQEQCAIVAADGTVTIPSVSLIPGETTLTATASDNVGNEGTATLTIDVDVDRPSLVITAPANGSATTNALTDVSITTDLSEGLAVDLYLNDEDTVLATATVDENGVALFNNVSLVENQTNVLWATGTDARGVGFSPRSIVIIDTSVPVVDFTTPVDAAVFNGQSPDVDGAPGFQTNITFASPGILDGQPAVLKVNCGNGESDYNADVQSGNAAFERVTLDNNATCLLTGQVTNRAMTMGSSSISVRVDRDAPELVFQRLENGGIVNINDDVLPADDGIQMTVRISALGLEEGQTVSLSDSEGTFNLTSDPFTAGQDEAVFGPLTLPDGEISLTATASDSAGNMSSRVINLLVDSSNLVTNITSPANNAVLNANNDLDPDTDGFQAQIIAAGVPALRNNPVKLCSNVAPDGAEACNTGGYSVVAEGTFDAAISGVVFPVTLVEGSQSFLTESYLESDDQLVVSPPVAVNVDSVRPTVTSFTLASDDIAPTGLVGSQEDENVDQIGFAANFLLETEGFEEDALIRLYDQSAPTTAIIGNTVAADGTVEISFNFANEGVYNLFPAGRDAANNDIATPPVLTFEIDTTAPTLTFSNVFEGQQFSVSEDEDTDTSGLQFAVSGLSDEVGAEVTLWSVTGDLDPFGAPTDDVMLATTTVAENGAVDFTNAIQLPSGAHTLAIRTTDEASNETTTTVNVVVDVEAPVISIVAPASDATFTEEDPVFETRPGFQIALMVESDTPNASIEIFNTADELLVNDPINDPVMTDGDGNASVVVTLTKGLSTLEARITDPIGNEGTSSIVNVNVDIAGCGVLFVAPDENPVLVSTDNDDDPSNGVALTFEAVVADVATCLGQNVELYVNDELRTGIALTESGNVLFENVVFPNSSTSTVLAQVDDGEGNVTATPLMSVLVDLIAPTVAFVTPADDPAIFNQSHDNGAADGLQTSLTFEVQNALGGTLSIASSADAEPIASGISIDDTTVTVPGLTFPEGTQTVTVTVTDRVNANANATAEFEVDLTSPSAVAATGNVSNVRLGTTALNWAAVGDDGATGTVDHYEVRAATSPIVTEEDFENATLLSTVAAGTTSYDIGKLDWAPPLEQASITHYIEVRAFDDVGNGSDLGDDFQVTLGLNEAEFGGDPGGSDFGRRVFPLGDINNDGFDDLLAYAGSTNSNTMFNAAIVYGRADAATIDGTTDDFQLLTTSDNLFGFGATALGDINGDDLDDFAISAAFGNGFYGAVYIYFGVDGGGMISGTPDVTINGPTLADGGLGYFGLTIATATNFADDAGENLPDLIIGAYGENTTVGGAYVVLGRTTWPGTIDLVDGDDVDHSANKTIRLAGSVAAGSFGFQVAGIDDINGDGFSEVVVSAPYVDTNDGAVHLFSGGALSSFTNGLATAGVDDQEVAPFVSGGQFGAAMVAGDVNGDGTQELVVNAYAGNDALGIFDFSGDFPTAPSEAFYVNTGSGGFFYGERVALADINNDGKLDLIAGGSTNDGNTQGFADIFFNVDGAFGAPNSDLSAPHVPNIRYKRNGSWGIVNSIGDFNGDGYDDIAVGQPEASGGGKVVILY